jgi:nucleotide-binding universal stress UspA family protein
MSTKTKVVMACIDGSHVSAAVCDYGAWIANTIKAPLKLLHTIEHVREAALTNLSGSIGLGSREGLLDELAEVEQNRNRLLMEEGRYMLEAARSRVLGTLDQQPELCQRHGSLAESLIELEARIGILVLGIRGQLSEQQGGVGTQLESVIRALHRPIFVVNRDFKQPRRTMLAYDGSPACKKALDMIISSPLSELPCHVVHVGDQGEALLEEAKNALHGAGLEVHNAQLQGKIVDALCQYQVDNDIDLTLMGAFSHNRIRDFLLGSFTHEMLVKSDKPLLLLR